MVEDGDGNSVGKFLGYIPPATYDFAYPRYQVLIQDGAYQFSAGGFLLPTVVNEFSPVFKNDTCTGSAFARVGYSANFNPDTLANLAGSAGGPARLVIRQTDPTYGTPRVYSYSATSEVYTGKLWFQQANGTCYPADSGNTQTYKLLALNAEAVPDDLTPPLSLK